LQFARSFNHAVITQKVLEGLIKPRLESLGAQIVQFAATTDLCASTVDSAKDVFEMTCQTPSGGEDTDPANVQISMDTSEGNPEPSTTFFVWFTVVRNAVQLVSPKGEPETQILVHRDGRLR
jgi:hypothetical protein